MNTVREVKPKSEARRYKGHNFVLSYRPAAPIAERWQWHVKFTRVYEFVGSAATIDRAAKEAQTKIDAMLDRGERSA